MCIRSLDDLAVALQHLAERMTAYAQARPHSDLETHETFFAARLRN